MSMHLPAQAPGLGFSVDWTIFCGFYRVQDKSTCYYFTAWCQVSRGEAPERMASIVGMLFPRMHSLKIYPVDTEDGPCHAKVHFSGRVPDKKRPTYPSWKITGHMFHDPQEKGRDHQLHALNF